jgi:hypothetical protein
MPTLKVHIRRLVLGVPVAAMIGASFFPLPVWCQQALVCFALVWFNVFILSEVIGN